MRVPFVAVVLIVATSCTAGEKGADATSVATDGASTDVIAASEALFAVDALGLTFRLPDSFRAVDDPDYQFFARSTSPRALFTIEGDVPSVIDHEPENGEVVSDYDLGNIDVVEVTNAALDGMPAGVTANELLVSNGEDQSFSVIMSGPAAELAELWDIFVSSVDIAPSDCCSSDGAATRIMGAENACEADIEVTVNEDPTIEQPQHAWVLVPAGGVEAVANIDVPRVAFFVRTPNAVEGEVYELTVDQMITVVGGPIDVLIRVTGDSCPASVP